MKSRILTVSILLLIFCKFGFSQRIVVERVNFSNIPIVNNEVQVNYNFQTVLKVGFLLARPVQEPWGSLPIKGEIKVFYYKDNQEVNIIDVVPFDRSNWDNSVFSKFIERNIFLPANSVTLANPKIQVLTKWRYYKEGYPDPENTDGWTNWYNAGSITFALNPNSITPTTFSGPSSICGDGIYTLNTPYSISLINAEGKATLTPLGNNQWKVSRISNASGRIILRSASGFKNFDKDIVLGSPTSKDITNGFEGNLSPGVIYDFELKSGFQMDSFDWSVIGGTIISGKNSSTVKVKIDMNPYQGLNNFSISLNYTGECGSGSVSANRYVNSSGSGGGGTPID